VANQPQSNDKTNTSVTPEELKRAEELWKALEDHVISQKENRGKKKLFNAVVRIKNI